MIWYLKNRYPPERSYCIQANENERKTAHEHKAIVLVTHRTLVNIINEKRKKVEEIHLYQLIPPEF